MDTISKCTETVQQWMTNNCLKVNGDKSELLVISAPSLTRYCPRSLSVCDVLIDSSECVRNLGVMFDQALTLKDNISHICRKA